MYAWLTKTERGDAMADNNNNKRKGGGSRKKTIWDIIADYALLWWALIMGTIFVVFILSW